VQVPDANVSHALHIMSMLTTNTVASIPSESGQSDVGKTTKSRMRRIMTGEEVLLTPESVDDLAILPITSPILPTQPEGVPDLQTKPVKVLSGFVSSSILSPVPTPLAHRPKWGAVSSGNAGLEFRFLGGSDPFSAFPGCNEEPVPKQLLIHYCSFPLLLLIVWR
jgi:hypothetical protein